MKNTRIEIHLVDTCNLNCAGCSHFAPVAPEGYLSLEQLAEDLLLVSRRLGRSVKLINLLGGEPLLHPQLTEVFKLVRLHLPWARIQLVTNGILLPKMSPDFWRACRDSHIIIAVTRYPIGHFYFGLAAKALRYEVRLRFYNWGFNRWFRRDLLGESETAAANFKACKKPCPQVRNGRIYPCPAAAYAEILNERFGANLMVTEGDYIDLNSEFSVEEYKEFLANPIPFCRYCMASHRVRWDVSQQQREEWLA